MGYESPELTLLDSHKVSVSICLYKSITPQTVSHTRNINSRDPQYSLVPLNDRCDGYSLPYEKVSELETEPSQNRLFFLNF